MRREKMNKNIANLLSVSSTLSTTGFDKPEPVVTKVRSDYVPEIERWKAKMEKNNEKRIQLKLKQSLIDEANSIKKEFAAKKAAKQLADSNKSKKEKQVEEKPATPVVKEYNGYIGKRVAGSISAKHFLGLVSDLRSLQANERDPSNLSTNSIDRMKDLCSQIGMDFNFFMQLPRQNRMFVALDAYVGYKPNMPAGIQLSCAVESACVETNTKYRVDFNSHVQNLNSAFNRKVANKAGQNLEPAKEGWVFGSNTSPEVKRVLDFAGRAEAASSEIRKIIWITCDPDYVRDLSIFKTSVLSLISWISCETVLKEFEEYIHECGYTDFISKNAEDFLCMCKLLGFNSAQASRIVMEGMSPTILTNEDVDAFVVSLLKLDNITIMNESPRVAFAKLSDVFKK